ncbi:Pentatricopeptide repeat-containing protein At4g01030, mitochondrial [Linum perenne]
MQREGISPNSATISSLLRTCGGLSLLQKGKESHCFSIKNRFFEDVYVATALIDMYSKSGSWIQIDEQVHVFTAGGKPHRDEGEIYFELYQMILQIKELGYEPDMNCVVQNVDDDEKVKLLLGHTEKLAITYGLIKRRSCSSNVPIRVIKNTRTCSDCHSVAKLISLAKGCEIILRDGVRFHHFKDGKCSCNDYW